MDDPWIWIGLVIVGFLFFGAKRMPDAARGLGRSLRIFKAETKGLLTDEEPAAQTQIPAAAPVYAPPVQSAPAAAPVYAAPVQQAPVAAPVYAAPVQQAPAAPAEQPVPEHRDAQ